MTLAAQNHITTGENPVRYSSFNSSHRGKRGWIFGPFFGRLLTITVERTSE